MNISMLSGLAALGLATLPVASPGVNSPRVSSSNEATAVAVTRPVIGQSPVVSTPFLLSPTALSTVTAPVAVDFESVEIVTKDNLTLAGSWFAPRKKKGQPVPGVVLLHDAGSDRTSMNGVADRLRKDGFAVASVDLRGHGQSKTDKLDWNGLSEEEQNAQWAFAQRDVNAAVDWLLSQPNVHSTRLTVVGHGAGCALAARHMRDDVNAIAVALIEPRTECFGFKVDRDLVDLEGLPTYVVASSDDKDGSAKAMVQEANSGSGDEPFVELWLTRPPVLTGTKTAKQVSGFLKEHAIQKKGR